MLCLPGDLLWQIQGFLPLPDAFGFARINKLCRGLLRITPTHRDMIRHFPRGLVCWVYTGSGWKTGLALNTTAQYDTKVQVDPGITFLCFANVVESLCECTIAYIEFGLRISMGSDEPDTAPVIIPKHMCVFTPYGMCSVLIDRSGYYIGSNQLYCPPSTHAVIRHLPFAVRNGAIVGARIKTKRYVSYRHAANARRIESSSLYGVSFDTSGSLNARVRDIYMNGGRYENWDSEPAEALVERFLRGQGPHLYHRNCRCPW
jgi:hypothetical protein